MSGANKGFTLIELMISVAIIGILVTIAFPSYRQYVVESRRSEGIAMLLQVMQQQERYYTEELTYSTNLTDLGFAVANPTSQNSHYTISAARCGSDPVSRCVLLTAVAQGQQVVDGNLTLNSRGIRTPAAYWQ